MNLEPCQLATIDLASYLEIGSVKIALTYTYTFKFSGPSSPLIFALSSNFSYVGRNFLPIMNSIKLVKNNIILWKIIIVLGISIAFLAASSAYQSYIFVHTALHAKGTVLAYITGADGDTHTHFSFQDAHGTAHRVNSLKPVGKIKPAVGSMIDVMYMPQDPEGAQVNDHSDPYRGAYFLLLLAMFFLLGGSWRLFMFQSYLKNINYLCSHGTKITGKLISIKKKSTFGYLIPFFIPAYVAEVEGQNPQTHETIIFSSWKNNAPIFYDLQKVAIPNVEILIDPQNPTTNYFIEMEQFLSKTDAFSKGILHRFTSR